MKNLKAVAMIILGSFFLATGFAFASDSAMGQLKSNPFSTVSGADYGTLKAAGANLPALQEKLKCGTTCGSCVPEIKRMLATPQAA